MNDKQSFIHEVLDIIVECCSVNINGKESITAEEILSQSRKDNVIMSRCILVTQLAFCGYSRSTIAAFLNRGEKAISNMLNQAHQYRVQSYAYRIAEAEATIRLKEIITPQK